MNEVAYRYAMHDAEMKQAASSRRKNVRNVHGFRHGLLIVRDIKLSDVIGSSTVQPSRRPEEVISECERRVEFVNACVWAHVTDFRRDGAVVEHGFGVEARREHCREEQPMCSVHLHNMKSLHFTLKLLGTRCKVSSAFPFHLLHATTSDWWTSVQQASLVCCAPCIV
jgi:hypothetical protein